MLWEAVGFANRLPGAVTGGSGAPDWETKNVAPPVTVIVCCRDTPVLLATT